MPVRPEAPQAGKFYEGVAPELIDRLQRFRARHPYKTATIDGRDWCYLDVGSGDRVLLVLTGAACIAEMG